MPVHKRQSRNARLVPVPGQVVVYFSNEAAAEAKYAAVDAVGARVLVQHAENVVWLLSVALGTEYQAIETLRTRAGVMSAAYHFWRPERLP